MRSAHGFKRSIIMRTLSLTTVFCLLAAWTYNVRAAEYRSRDSGDWSDPSTWQVYDGYWQAAAEAPGSADYVLIRSGHGIVVQAAHAAASGVTIEANGSLSLAASTRELLLYDGRAGADLFVAGLLHDHGAAGYGVNFIGSATWQLGADATFIKSNNSSAADYQSQYHGGAGQMPATANWIIQYTGSGSPAFTSVNAYYPNLSFVSTAGAWNPGPGFSRFQGGSGTATIMGSLSVGAGVTLYNENTYAEPISVGGDLYIAAGAAFTNAGQSTGTGVAVYGSVWVDGALLLNGGGSGGLLRLHGHELGGSGPASLYDVEVQTAGELAIMRPLTIEHDLALLSGKVALDAYPLTVEGEIWGYNSARYVRTTGAGGLVLPGAGSLYYPVGQDQYQPLLVNYHGYQQAPVRVSEGVLSQGSTGEWMWDNVVMVSWHFEGAPGSFDATAQWLTSQEGTGFNRQSCYLSYYQSPAWSAGSPAAALGSGPYQQSRNGLSGAGTLIVASSNALPAGWGLLSAHRQSPKEVQLSWTTLYESNTHVFYIEHSPDARRFQMVGAVAAAGHSPTARQYQFTHLSPEAGYYRLMLEDADGSLSFSGIVYVDADNPAEQALVFPNPAKDRLWVTLPQGQLPTTWQMVDAQGRLHPLPANTEARFELDLSGWPPGAYLLMPQGGGKAIAWIKSP